MNQFRRRLLQLLSVIFLLLATPLAQAVVFSGIDGLPAFQKSAAQDPTLAPILNRWKDAINFYISSGMLRFPTGLVAELSGTEVQVDFSKTQAQLDAVTLSSSAGSSNQSSAVTTDSAVSSINTSSTSITANEATSATASGVSGNSNPDSSQGNTGGESEGVGSSSDQSGDSSGTQNTVSGSLKPTQTSFIISSLFGSLIQGIGGVSSSSIMGKPSKFGGINTSGTRVSSSITGGGGNVSDESVGSGGISTSEETGSTNPSDSEGTDPSNPSDSEGTDPSNPSDSEGTGPSNPSDSEGTGPSNPSDSESTANLNLDIGAIIFREYGSSRNVVISEQRIGVDLSEDDFLKAVETSNPRLKAIYEALKSQLDVRDLAQKILALDPEQEPPVIVLADDNQVDDGLGLHPFYDPGAANELVLGNTGLGSDLEQALATLLHELAHSQQKISFLASEQIYGPDNNHFGTEILTEKVAATEGWSEFWEAYYAPEIWGGLELGLATCGFRTEDSDSTIEAPKYNGKAIESLECEDYTPFQNLDVNDYFKSEGWFASLLLEVALRVDGSFDLISSAFTASNSESQTTRDLIFALSGLMSESQRSELAIILDVLTAFKLTTSELQAMTLTTQDQINQYVTYREILKQRANETIDDNGRTVRYNGFHALDSVQGNPLLPRIDPRAASRGVPKAATLINGSFFLAPVKESHNFLSGKSSENIDFQRELNRPSSHGEIIRNF